MTDRNPNTFHLSASSLAAFKACPQRFRLSYREGLRRAEDTDAQRVGTNWHALHEEYHRILGQDATVTSDEAFDQVVVFLNERYADSPPPSSKTVEEWDIERMTLITSFAAYLWYWSEDPVTSLGDEVSFKLPLHTPRTGMALPLDEVVRVGKIDHIISWQGMLGPLERKSTSRSIDPSSDFWETSRKSSQVSMYALAMRDMAESGQLAEVVGSEDTIDRGRMGNTLYDVWRKPTMKPKALTQADTAAVLETGEYCGQAFEISASTGDDDKLCQVIVDGVAAGLKDGKKANALIETPAMFAARLFADIQERPEHYFQRKEIVRTDRELDKFRRELFNIYTMQWLSAKTNCWYENESQCRATFACTYVPICYGPGAEEVCDGETTPPGFKRIFTDLTVNNTPT